MRKRIHGDLKQSSAASSASRSTSDAMAGGQTEAMYQSYNEGTGENIRRSNLVPPGGVSSLLSSTTGQDALLLQQQSLHSQQHQQYQLQQLQQQHQLQIQQQQMQNMIEGNDSTYVSSPGFPVVAASPPSRPQKSGVSQKPASRKRPSERKSKVTSITAQPLLSPIEGMMQITQQQMSPLNWMAPAQDESATSAELSPSFLAMQRNQQFASNSSSSLSSSSWAQSQPKNMAGMIHSNPQQSDALVAENITGLSQAGMTHQKFGVGAASMPHDDLDEYSDTEVAGSSTAPVVKSSRQRQPSQQMGVSGSQVRPIMTDNDVNNQHVKQTGRHTFRLQEFGRNVGELDAQMPGDRYGSPPLVGGPSILPGSGGSHPHDSHLYLLSASGRLSAPSVPQGLDTSPHLASGSNDGMGVTLSSWQLLTGLSDSRGSHNPQTWKGRPNETPGFERISEPTSTFSAQNFDVGIGPYTSNGRFDNSASQDLKRRSDQRHTPTQLSSIMIQNQSNSPALLDDSVESLADMSNDRGKKRSKGGDSELNSETSSFGRTPQINLFFATPIGVGTGIAPSPPEHLMPTDRGTVSPALGINTSNIAMPLVRHAAPAVDTFLAPFEQNQSSSSRGGRSTKYSSQSALKPVPSRVSAAIQLQPSTRTSASDMLNYGPLETGGIGITMQTGLPTDVTPPWPSSETSATGMGDASEMSGSLSHSFSNMIVEDVVGIGGGGGVNILNRQVKDEAKNFKDKTILHELILEEDSVDV